MLGVGRRSVEPVEAVEDEMIKKSSIRRMAKRCVCRVRT